MTKLEAEISAGRLSAPAGDNAMETLQRILALVPDATPSDLDAIDAMPSRFDQRAAEARMRGDRQAAERFSEFRDAFAPGDRGAPAAGKTSPHPAAPAASRLPASPPAASPPAASPAPAADLSSVVKRLEPKAETQAAGSHGPPQGVESGGPNRPASPPVPAEPRPAAVAAAPRPAPVPSAPPKPGQAKSFAGPAPPAPANAAPMPAAMTAVLLRRGEEKLAQGDISAARLLFQRAATSGSGPGAAGLAKTYDPLFLAALGASGIQPDAGTRDRMVPQGDRPRCGRSRRFAEQAGAVETRERGEAGSPEIVIADPPVVNVALSRRHTPAYVSNVRRKERGMRHGPGTGGSRLSARSRPSHGSICSRPSRGSTLSLPSLKQDLLAERAIDRRQPGFADFDPASRAAIVPGDPASSLLYHALASPLVKPPCASPNSYPTTADLDLIENYILSLAPLRRLGDPAQRR